LIHWWWYLVPCDIVYDAMWLTIVGDDIDHWSPLLYYGDDRWRSSDRYYWYCDDVVLPVMLMPLWRALLLWWRYYLLIVVLLENYGDYYSVPVVTGIDIVPIDDHSDVMTTILVVLLMTLYDIWWLLLQWWNDLVCDTYCSDGLTPVLCVLMKAVYSVLQWPYSAIDGQPGCIVTRYCVLLLYLLLLKA